MTICLNKIVQCKLQINWCSFLKHVMFCRIHSTKCKLHYDLKVSVSCFTWVVALRLAHVMFWPCDLYHDTYSSSMKELESGIWTTSADTSLWLAYIWTWGFIHKSCKPIYETWNIEIAWLDEVSYIYIFWATFPICSSLINEQKILGAFIAGLQRNIILTSHLSHLLCFL